MSGVRAWPVRIGPGAARAARSGSGRVCGSDARDLPEHLSDDVDVVEVTGVGRVFGVGRSRRPPDPSAPAAGGPSTAERRSSFAPWRAPGFARAAWRCALALCLGLGALGLVPLPAAAQEDVPIDWPLKPDGLDRGDTFRLMFVSTNTRNGGSSIMSNYNNVVRTAAENGHSALYPYRDQFNAVASTSNTDARDNTDTNPNSDGPGEPIYWVGGRKIANDYADFYDGSWETYLYNATSTLRSYATTESGVEIAMPQRVWTGSEDDGTDDFVGGSGTSLALRNSGGATIDGGRAVLASGSTGRNITNYDEGTTLGRAMWSHERSLPFFGMSPVFRVQSGPSIVSAQITSLPRANNTFYRAQDIEVTVTFDEPVRVTGTPHVFLHISESTVKNRTTAYVRQDGPYAMVFRHTVTSLDRDTNGVCLGEDCRADTVRLGANESIVSRIDDAPANLDYARDTSGYRVDGRTAGLSSGVCDRTWAVRSRAVDLVSTADNCSQVSAADLAALNLFTVNGDTGYGPVPGFAARDFEGMDGLESLYIQNQDITGLSDDLFSHVEDTLAALGVTGNESYRSATGAPFANMSLLHTLYLKNNALNDIPASFLSGVSPRVLDLRDNDLRTLPNGLFGHMRRLNDLKLTGNPGADGWLPEVRFVSGSGTQTVDAGAAVEVSVEPTPGANPWGTNVTWRWVRTDVTGVALAATGLSSSTLSFTAPAQGEPRTYRFELTVTAKGAPRTVTREAAITVRRDASTPTIADTDIVSTPEAADDTYRAGESIELEVTFSEDVTVTRGHTGSGANRVFFPRIRMIVGSAARSFAYDRTEGGNRAIFAYTVKRGDEDADGIELCPNTDSRCTGTIDLGSGSNRGAIVAFDDGTDASRVYTIPPVWADHKVAARARPGISGVAVTATPADGEDTFKRDERIEATVTFDEPVSVTGAAGAGNGIVLKVQFRSGSGTNNTKDFGYLRQPSARTLVFGYTVASGDDDDDGLCFGASCAADDLVLQGSAAIAAELDAVAAGLGHVAFETPWKIDGDQAGLTGGVCGRSIPVRDALVAASAGADDCSDVSTTRLGLIATLDMSGEGLAELQAGDLDGLTALTGLDLSDNALTGLPAALFDDLVALSTLDLGDNALGSLPAGILLPLHATLTQLNLGGNPLGSLGVAPFSGLAALVVLDLEHAGLTSLPASIFQDLAALRDLDLKGNAFTTLPATVFRGRSALAELDLERSGLASLPADVFQGLGALVDLDLHDNDLAALAAGLFDGAAALTTLDISGNALAALPDAIFQPLTALDSLDFSDNPGVDDFVPAFTVSGAERVRAQGAVELVAAVEGNPWGSNLAAWAWTRTDSEAVTLSLAGADTPTLGFEAPSLAADAEIVFEVTATARGHTASAAAHWTVAIASTASIAGFAVTSRAVEGGTYRQGETIELTASFTERVFVNGAPALEIRVGAGNGGARRDAAYRSGTGTAELVFAYTVHPSDSDSDGVHVGANALALEGGTVRNALGENAVLGFAAPGRFTGVVVAGGTLPATGGICDRTREVREELVALSALATSCADMGAAELAALPVSLELHSLGIVALKPGDFAGLGQVVVLDLSANALTEVTPGVLDPLTALIQLGLVGNKIARVPAAVFDPLTELTQLGFSNNRIATLLPGTFDRLTKLRSLDLSDNQLAAFPDRIFEPLTELTDVSLTGNPGSADFKPAAAARVVDGTALVWQGVELEIDGSASEGGAWGSNLLYAWELDGVPGQVAMFDDASAASTTVRFVEMSGMGGSTGLKLVVRGRGGALTSSERIPLSVQRQPAVTSIAFSSLPRLGGAAVHPVPAGRGDRGDGDVFGGGHGDGAAPCRDPARREP